ncbi:MAG: glycosyltransferase [Firmicutes bacterium]|nr:glycosyltransferase [Bacillota bacterium]
MKKCIFYLPYKLDENGAGARMLRPKKMIQAFKDIGYDVFVITGYSTERKKLIKEVKNRILSGDKFDFMYTESHTEPTLLTDPSHLPTHPLMDFGFYKFVNNNRIRIGLFYCDFYWKFDTYGTNLPSWKRWGALINYKYDIRQYKKYLSKLYVASIECCDLLGEPELTRIASELPPGADDIVVDRKNYQNRDFSKEPLQVFYVGGLGNHYQVTELVKAINRIPACELTICCREAEWVLVKPGMTDYLCDRIHIIHKTNKELEEYYEKADLCSLMFQNSIYMNVAMPFKAFEYLAHEKPVFATQKTAIGRFVEDHGIGWVFPYDANAIELAIKDIIKNPSLLSEKVEKCVAAKDNNLWIERAKKVASDLQ